MIRLDVSVREGKLIGTIEEALHGGQYVSFRGIPYAKPPVGKLRFKDPLPPESWSSSRDASKCGNIPVQFDMMTKEIVGDEDCLYLNVYTKDIVKMRPVMVWIYGGGFSMGSGDISFYGPDYIVRKDVVLVTLNYRLGPLGFLNLNDKVATGNQGLKDVVMALQWIQENISQFGGDPKNVTIFGESAGGAIVHCLTLSPLAEGLFHKAISQSGVITNPWAFTERTNVMNKSFQLAEKLGKITSNPKIAYEFLKTIDAKDLVKAAEEFLATEIERLNITVFTPSLDYESPNPFFPEHPYTLMQRGVKVPFILGSTSCEGSIFINNPISGQISKETLKQIDSDFKMTMMPNTLYALPKIPITVQELRFLYFGNKVLSEETLTNYVDFLGDSAFYRGTMEVADVQINSSPSTYLYKFSYESKSDIKKIFGNIFSGASHGEDIFFLFHSDMMIKYANFLPPAPNSEDYKMINRLTQMWTNFAKTGDPTPVITDLTPVKWTPLKHGDVYDYLNIDIEPRMEAIRKEEHRCNWENRKRRL